MEFAQADEYRMEADRAYSGQLAEGEQEVGGVMEGIAESAESKPGEINFV